MSRVLAIALVMSGCAGSNGSSANKLSQNDARQIERNCGLPIGSIIVSADGASIFADPPAPYEKAFKSVGCVVAELQKRNVKMGRIGFISEPPKAQ